MGSIKPQTRILKSGILVSQKSAARFKELMLVERQGYYLESWHNKTQVSNLCQTPPPDLDHLMYKNYTRKGGSTT